MAVFLCVGKERIRIACQNQRLMTKPPFPFPPTDLLAQLASALPPPPEWLRGELQNRLVLFLNHVLMQEPQAMERLRRQRGKVLQAEWGRLSMGLQVTAAGLFAVDAGATEADLRVTLTQTDVPSLMQALAAGHKPAVDIQGDVQFAAEIAWLVDNVRWDVEEDLSRFMGDAAAHGLVQGVKGVLQSLQAWVRQAAGQARQWRDQVAARMPGQPGSSGAGSATGDHERNGAPQ